MSSQNFMPNTSCGPCLYCGASSEGKPQELVACDLCRRPLHLACLENGHPQTSLLGDNFFQATCAACSADGQDSVARPDISTVQILLLVLYNLHLRQEQSSRAGFFHWKIHILHFLTNHWKEIESPAMYRKRKKMVQSALTGQLAHYTRYFNSGQAVLGEGGWYRLAQVVPPAVALLGGGTGQGGKDLQPHPAATEDSTQHHPPPPPSSPTPSTSSEGAKRVKSEPTDTDEWSYPDPSHSTWFTERGILTPHLLPPKDLFEGEGPGEEEEGKKEGGKKEEDGKGATRFRTSLAALKHEITIKEEAIDETFEGELQCIVDEVEDEEQLLNIEYGGEEGGAGCGGEPKYLQDHPSLFPSPSTVPPPSLHPYIHSSAHSSRKVRQMSRYEERILVRRLEKVGASHLLPAHLYRLRRKLVVRSQKVEHGLPLFSVDQEVDHWRLHGRIRAKRERVEGDTAARSLLHTSTRILDRFQVAGQHLGHREEHNMSFAARLGGSGGGGTLIHSPYTLRYLKPYIRRDYECTPLKLSLLREVVSHHHQEEPCWQPAPPHPIDYCYVAPRHIPAMNQLARHFFWPGIDLSEVLQYPDHTCVVLYRHLVVGFGVLVPDTGYNEAYLSFLLVHPEWRGAGIGTFLLYHLIQTCPGKDVTLHVSATNPALILYQRFGFKVEEFLSNFYDKYLPDDSPECTHGMFMRLSR